MPISILWQSIINDLLALFKTIIAGNIPPFARVASYIIMDEQFEGVHSSSGKVRVKYYVWLRGQ